MHLAEALSHFYQRNKGVIVFRGGLSLNKLALLMWEQAGSCGIDASVLSKVLNGRRLFTPQQLSVFCAVMLITGAEREYLFHCLYADQNQKNGVPSAAPFIAAGSVHAFIEGLMRQTEAHFLAGRWKDVYELTTLMSSCLYEHVAVLYHARPDDILVRSYQQVLYWRAKSISSVASPLTVMEQVESVIGDFRRYPHTSFDGLAAGYIDAFRASAFRVMGVFSSALDEPRAMACAVRSRRHAAKALDALPEDNFEYVGCLRNVLDASITLVDSEAFFKYAAIAERIMPMQPSENFLYVMQLAATIGKGRVVFGSGDPFATKESMMRHFGRTLSGAKVYELSDLKSDLEIHVTLNSAKDAGLLRKIQRALTLSREESPRYEAIITHLAAQLR